MQDILIEIRQTLVRSVDKKTKNGSSRFFKENEAVTVHGVKMSSVNKITKEFFKEIQHKPKQEVFAICDELWCSSYLEETIIACGFAYALRKQYEPMDLKCFHSWLKNGVNNWAVCDTLCNRTIGTLLEMYPASINELKHWTQSANRWERRGAAVSLIIPARKGLFLNDILEIATVLLLDQDDLVQKGYGWMLKVASQVHQQAVF